MRLSDSIERFIKELLDDEDIIELGRNELAAHFGCAPSQINYVLATRFTLERGYSIESRRGGGGFIRVVRVDMTRDELLRDLITNQVEKGITLRDAQAITRRLFERDVISPREMALMNAAMTNIGISSEGHNSIARANILKSMLMMLIAPPEPCERR